MVSSLCRPGLTVGLSLGRYLGTVGWLRMARHTREANRLIQMCIRQSKEEGGNLDLFKPYIGHNPKRRNAK